MSDVQTFEGLDTCGIKDIPIKKETEEYIYEFREISSFSGGKGELITNNNDSVNNSNKKTTEAKFKKHIFCCVHCNQVSFTRRSFKEHLKFHHYENIFVEQPKISKIKIEVSDYDCIEGNDNSSEGTLNIDLVKNHESPESNFGVVTQTIIQKQLKSLQLIQKLKYSASDKKGILVPINSFSDPIVNFELVKQYSCPECHFRSAYPTSIRRHINIVHSKSKPHACDHCDYRTYMQRQLNLHIAAKHSTDKAFKCSMCEYSSVQKRYLKRHITAVHTDEGRQPCPFCDFSTVYVEYLKHHIRAKHTQERPYVCPDCGHAFALSGHLRNHIISVHKKIKRYSCKECDYRCSQSGDMRRHVNARHAQKQFQCPYCDYRSATVYQLRSHIKGNHSKT